MHRSRSVLNHSAGIVVSPLTFAKLQSYLRAWSRREKREQTHGKTSLEGRRNSIFHVAALFTCIVLFFIIILYTSSLFLWKRWNKKRVCEKEREWNNEHTLLLEFLFHRAINSCWLGLKYAAFVLKNCHNSKNFNFLAVTVMDARVWSCVCYAFSRWNLQILMHSLLRVVCRILKYLKVPLFRKNNSSLWYSNVWSRMKNI